MNMKKFTTLATSVFVALLVSAFAFTVVGCGDPEAGPAGSSGGAGGPDTTYLSGTQPTAVIQHAIDAGGPLVFGDLENDAAGTISVPAGRAIHVIGNFTLAASSTLIAQSGAFEFDTTATGNIVAGGSTVIALDDTIAAKVSGGDLLEPATVSDEGVVDLTKVKSNKAALVGNYSIVEASPSATALGKAQFAGAITSLYIIGNLTDFTAESVTTTAIYATGTAKLSADASIGTFSGIAGVELAAKLTGKVETKGALTISVENKLLEGIDAGSLTSTKEVKSSATINVKGDLILSATGTDGALTTETNTTALLVGGNLTAASVTTSGLTANNPGGVTGGPALKVGGKVTITGALATAAAASIVEFNGGSAAEPSKIGSIAQGEALVIAGSGPVTVGSVGATAAAAVTIKNTAGVTITAETTIATNTDDMNATKATFVGTGGQGITLKDDASSITVPAGGKIIIAGEGASLVSTPGASTSITFTETDFNGGTYSPDDASFALGAGASIVVYSTGKIVLVGGQILEVAQNILSNITLLAGAELVGSATSLIQENGSDGAGVTLKAETADGSGAADDKLVVVDDGGTPKIFTITTAAAGAGGSVIVGKAQWVAGDSVEKGTGVAANTKVGGAVGVLKAGANTNLILCGST